MMKYKELVCYGMKSERENAERREMDKNHPRRQLGPEET